MVPGPQYTLLRYSGVVPAAAMTLNSMYGADAPGISTEGTKEPLAEGILLVCKVRAVLVPV
jgi:hypothetical protein